MLKNIFRYIRILLKCQLKKDMSRQLTQEEMQKVNIWKLFNPMSSQRSEINKLMFKSPKKISYQVQCQSCKGTGTLMCHCGIANLYSPFEKSRSMKKFMFFDLAIPLLGTFPRNRITNKKKSMCIKIFKAQKTWEWPKCPIIGEQCNKI